MKATKLGFLGGGNMATALIRGLLDSGLLTAEQIRVSDVLESQLKPLRDSFSVATDTNNRAVLSWANVILVAVKPQVVPKIVPDLVATHRAEQLLISIVAGTPIASFSAALPATARIIRAMPNTPALVHRAATALAAGPHATDADVAFALQVFRAVGTAVVLPEHQLDAVTGLSGSGPGYVMLMVEALADGGVRAGLARDVALSLAIQTLYGSAELLSKTGEHPAVLKDRVASPGGTTIAGLCALEARALRSALIEAVLAATKRSAELGRAQPSPSPQGSVSQNESVRAEGPGGGQPRSTRTGNS